MVGIPPSQLLHALRLQRAKRLLLTTDLSVTEICFEVGYNSLGSFTRRFSELVGVPPTHLRRLAEDEHLVEGLIPLRDCKSHDSLHLHQLGLMGRITTPEHFAGPIFVGLFRQRIPQGQPIGFALLSSPGSYRIGPVSDGRYYVFAAGLAWSKHPLGYLLPEEANTVVGVSHTPVFVQGGRCKGCADIVLRPLALIDPPLLIALPFLFTKHAPVRGNGAFA